MDGGIGEAALASTLAPDLGASLAGGLGAGAAGELGATSSGIGAAGAAANPFSIGFTNAVSGLGSPGLSSLAYKAINPAPGVMGRMGNVLQAGRLAGIGMPGAPQGAAPMARPPQGMPPMSAQSILGGQRPGMPGGSAGMVGQAMGGRSLMGGGISGINGMIDPSQLGGGMSPQLMQLLAMLKQGGQQ